MLLHPNTCEMLIEQDLYFSKIFITAVSKIVASS